MHKALVSRLTCGKRLKEVSADWRFSGSFWCLSFLSVVCGKEEPYKRSVVSGIKIYVDPIYASTAEVGVHGNDYHWNSLLQAIC